MKLSLFLSSLLLLGTPLFAQSPASAEASAFSSSVRPPDFPWWRDGRFGMFIHWGPAALTGKEISWSRNGTGIEKYDSLYKEFNPVRFNATEWVATAKAAGMKYMVLTAKHHDGFMLWDTKTGDYNIMHTPFGRDVVAELATAAKKADLPFCVYFSPGDWKDPDCRNPEANAKFVERMHAQITELLTHYGRIPLVWIDFDGFPNPSIPRETATLIRQLQPGALITNRLEALHPDESHGRIGKWGDYATPEQRVGSYCDTVPWETCMTIANQWNWKPNDKLKSLHQCLSTLVCTVGADGNLLFNVGPKPDGEIEPTQVARLKEMGAWLAKHGESIYGTRGGPYFPTKSYAATRTADTIYIHAIQLKNGSLTLPPLPAKVKSAALLDGTTVPFQQTTDAFQLTIPEASRDPNISVVKLTIEGDPMKLTPIVPASTSKSLAYRKPANVSSSIAPQFMHDAQAALDDDTSTYWTPGRDEAMAEEIMGKKFEQVRRIPNHPVWIRHGWLEVDLGKPQAVSRARIQEYGGYPPVSSWKIESENNGTWQVIAEGKTIGKSLDVPISTPATAHKFRLSIEADGRPAIAEFQLF
ncbi:MAG: alpha-L-fucosidase [Akkermansiaceae bacterium]